MSTSTVLSKYYFVTTENHLDVKRLRTLVDLSSKTGGLKKDTDSKSLKTPRFPHTNFTKESRYLLVYGTFTYKHLLI